jgi:hypothetical protein
MSKERLKRRRLRRCPDCPRGIAPEVRKAEAECARLRTEAINAIGSLHVWSENAARLLDAMTAYGEAHAHLLHEKTTRRVVLQ